MGTPLTAYVGDRRPRILIVDDEPVNLKVLAAHLARWGCVVQQAGSGPEALATIAGFGPDLILLDVMMPGQSGLEVCRHLQDDPALRRIPVIFLSAAAGEQAKELGLAAGARDYVTKPFMAADLAARVGAQLQQRYAEDTNP
jgi:CheY-like chemotaxis protein